MKQSLQLKLGQHLTMTPQLQQAIKLLQLSTLDLQQEIQQALEENPMLEMAEEENELAEMLENSMTAAEMSAASDNSSNSNNDSGVNGSGTNTSSEQDDNQPWNDDAIPTDLPVDSTWDDIYSNTTYTSSSSSQDDENSNFEQRNSHSESLQDHLLWQLNLTPMSDVDRVIALAIIDSINADGFLSSSPEDIHNALVENRNTPVNDQLEVSADEDEGDIELDEVIAVLRRIQHFDPVGVAARDLGECLQLQLNHLPADSPGLNIARLLTESFLGQLGNRDYSTIMKKARIKEEELKDAVDLIQTLNPRPGSIIDTDDTEYVVPDVFVRKKSGRWVVELNPDTSPRLRINADYASLVRRADNSTDNAFLRDHLQEARWFLKSLQSRNETLMKVATRIVEHQRGFLEYGEEAMKPLVLHDIAQAVEMHESTISRVTTQKYMHTPRGIYELKYFFSSHVGTESGGECSSTAIRAIIKKLISAESPKKPLSDNKIAELLKAKGIKVARRTIAKYREAMNIPPSNERKRLV